MERSMGTVCRSASVPLPLWIDWSARLVTWYQEWFGEEYLDLYSYRDDEEAKRHIAFVASHFADVDGEILDVACGSGRHVHELARHGLGAIGCDLSTTLLRKAIREHSARGLVVRADMRHLPFRDGHFGGLVNFFTSFGYFENESDNRAAAGEMARVARPGAPFLVDYLNVRRELARLVHRETRDLDGHPVLIERWFDGLTKMFNKRITIGARTFLERVRGYDLSELSELFREAGFRIGDVYGDFDGAPFGDASPRMILTGVRG